ncbi:MAG TPA: hypothetical protein VGN77_06720, partial [Steroidobacteraceae bacterium]|nr:hypothetical protein [Steroidobacteraceae bacterium]
MKQLAAIMLGFAAAGMANTALCAALRPFEASYGVIWHSFTAGVSSFALRQESDQEWTYVSRNQPR